MNTKTPEAESTDLSTPLSVEAISMLARRDASRALWLDEAGARSWHEFGAMVEAATTQCSEAGISPGSVVVTPGEAALESLAWLFGAAAVGAVIAPLRRERAGEIETWKGFIEIGWHVGDGRLTRVGEGTMGEQAAPLFAKLSATNHPGLILATGGTTGTPKLVLHDLPSLLAGISLKPGRPWRTLPLMRFDHIGGLDMAWRALAGGQVLVAPPAELTPSAVVATVARHQVEVLPATPSFLNLLLLAESSRTHDLSSLRIVPYGAEPMPAGLLARLRAALPGVEFVQRFGTSETGALPVRDAGGGLMLDPQQAGFAWKIVDRELWIHSPARALGYLAGSAGGFSKDGWYRTGDLAKLRPDGSLIVLGRLAEMINIGGEKVFPAEVEGVLLTHPLVADCRVGSAPNAVLGQVVTAEVVWRGAEKDAVEVKRLLCDFSSGLIARHKLPAVVRLVDSVAATRNLKKPRISGP